MPSLDSTPHHDEGYSHPPCPDSWTLQLKLIHLVRIVSAFVFFTKTRPWPREVVPAETCIIETVGGLESGI